MAGALGEAGLSTEAPLLPGHGTSVDDLHGRTWDDFVAAAEVAYGALAARVDRVVVVGHSMGGALACWLASQHSEVAGLVAVNPFVDPPAESFRDMLRSAIEQGHRSAPGVAGDLADPSAREDAYDAMPLAPLLSLCGGLDRLVTALGAVACPVLVITSRTDHVVPPVSSDVLAQGVSGPVERVWLERSFHVAPLDYDRAALEARAVGFTLACTAGADLGELGQAPDG